MTPPRRPETRAPRDTGTPVGRVLARIELVCCEILAGDVPAGGPSDWCRRLVVRKPCGTPDRLTAQARELAVTLNVCDRSEARREARRLLLHCEHVRGLNPAGCLPPAAARGFRLRATRPGPA